MGRSRCSTSAHRWCAWPPTRRYSTRCCRTSPRSARAARTARHLAARFCAKEAVAKALGMEGWNFRDVEVVATSGAPQVRLSGAVAERARELGAEPVVSLTHTDTTAAAGA